MSVRSVGVCGHWWVPENTRWASVTTRGHTWASADILDPWVPIGHAGHPSTSLGAREHPWASVGIRGYPVGFRGVRGRPWARTSVGIHGHPRASMGIGGRPWTCPRTKVERPRASGAHGRAYPWTRPHMGMSVGVHVGIPKFLCASHKLYTLLQNTRYCTPIIHDDDEHCCMILTFWLF